MTKMEVAKQWRSLLARAIRSLPDIEYRCACAHEDSTTAAERDHEAPGFRGELGALHTIELTAEEEPHD